MSITRSTSQRAPATDRTAWRDQGLLLVGHGSERGDGPNIQLMEQAAQLRSTGRFGDVQAAALHGAPSLATALANLGGQPVHVVPMFMCDGLFTRKIIPERVERARAAGQQVSFEAPIGLSDGMVGLIGRRIWQAVARDGLFETDVTVLMVGHGSTASDASWRATELHAHNLRETRVFRGVETAYLDQTPHVGAKLRDLRGRVYVVGLFAAEGAHAAEDVPQAINEAPNTGNIHYLGPIGADRGMVNLVLDRLMN